MRALDRITSNPACMNGQPCIRDLRLTVTRVLDALATYPDREELRREYPEISDEDIRQVLAYAAASLVDEVEPAHGDVLDLTKDVEPMAPEETRLAREAWRRYGDDFGQRRANLEVGRHPYQQTD